MATTITTRRRTPIAECQLCPNYAKVNRQLALLCDSLLDQMRKNGIEPEFEPITSDLAEAQSRLNQTLLDSRTNNQG